MIVTDSLGRFRAITRVYAANYCATSLLGTTSSEFGNNKIKFLFLLNRIVLNLHELVIWTESFKTFKNKLLRNFNSSWFFGIHLMRKRWFPLKILFIGQANAKGKSLQLVR